MMAGDGSQGVRERNQSAQGTAAGARRGWKGGGEVGCMARATCMCARLSNSLGRWHHARCETSGERSSTATSCPRFSRRGHAVAERILTRWEDRAHACPSTTPSTSSHKTLPLAHTPPLHPSTLTLALAGRAHPQASGNETQLQTHPPGRTRNRRVGMVMLVMVMVRVLQVPQFGIRRLYIYPP